MRSGTRSRGWISQSSRGTCIATLPELRYRGVCQTKLKSGLGVIRRKLNELTSKDKSTSDAFCGRRLVALQAGLVAGGSRRREAGGHALVGSMLGDAALTRKLCTRPEGFIALASGRKVAFSCLSSFDLLAFGHLCEAANGTGSAEETILHSGPKHSPSGQRKC